MLYRCQKATQSYQNLSLVFAAGGLFGRMISKLALVTKKILKVKCTIDQTIKLLINFLKKFHYIKLLVFNFMKRKRHSSSSTSSCFFCFCFFGEKGGGGKFGVVINRY